MVALYIANTDNNWFDFLARRADLVEVNFWQPGGKSFHAIGPGELFVFRLKSPRNKIGGYGVLSSSSVLPLQIAWETFREANGVSSYEDLEAAIAKYRIDEKIGPATTIGCRVLVQPVFLPEDFWIGVPDSWSATIVGGKRYSTDESDGQRLWHSLLQLGQVRAEFSEPAERYGAPTLITPRLGQGAFRVAVTEAYHRQCAISRGKVLPALDAAHIRPYASGGYHTKSNGILFRRDIHSIFDAGYVTVDKDYRFVVSRRIKDVFNNGEEYRRLHGNKLSLPSLEVDWPSVEFLSWHNTERFLE